MVGPNPVVVGQPLTYRLVARNLSTSVNATQVHVYDTVNNLRNIAGFPGLVSVTTTQGTCAPATPASVTSASIDCNLGTLNAGASATIDITIRPNNTTATDLTRGNTATVNSLDVGDPNRANNTSTVSSVVQPRVDMTVSKSVNPTPVRVGQPMTYTVTANNAGPSEATNVRITDVMPPNTAFISVGTPSNGGTCGTVPAADSTGGTLECTWASVPAGGNRTVTFTVRPLEAALGGGTTGTINNTVTVATDSTETNLDNNSASIPAEVIASLVDILVQKTDSVDPVVLGATTRYTITIRNSGDVPAQLMARHWIIKDATGKVQEVRGLGVVGHQPLLDPGETFQYQSQCRLATAQGSMEGSYFCITEDAEQFECPIPRFVLDATQLPSQDDLAAGRVLH